MKTLLTILTVLAISLPGRAQQATTEPIRIGVTAKFAQINGAAILNGARLATDEINQLQPIRRLN